MYYSTRDSSILYTGLFHTYILFRRKWGPVLPKKEDEDRVKTLISTVTPYVGLVTGTSGQW